MVRGECFGGMKSGGERWWWAIWVGLEKCGGSHRSVLVMASLSKAVDWIRDLNL